MDGSFVGTNPSSLVPPSGRIDYTVRAPAEGVFLMYSTAATAGDRNSGGGFGGQLSAGLFGSVVVEPATSEWYRSQVTKADLDAATKGRSADGHPLLNYAALRKEQDGSCTPVLRMVDVRYKPGPGGACVPAGRDLVTYYGDLTAMVTGPNAGPFPPQDSGPSFKSNPVEPNRHQPFREFVQHYHDVLTATQAFPDLYAANDTGYVLGNGAEAFAINYGATGIGSEILANRLGVGPQGGCVECRFEEFFLSSWAVGDPAMLVSKPDGLKSEHHRSERCHTSRRRPCAPTIRQSIRTILPTSITATSATASSSASCMPASWSPTCTTCTRISGCTRRTATPAPISTAS